MAESLPVVTVSGDDGALGCDDVAPQDIVVLHEVVVEELPVVEGLEEIDTTPFAIVTEPSEPSEPSTEDVIVIGSSGEEEEEEEEVGEGVERVAGGPPRGGMATNAGIHPVTVPSEMPIDDVPPDETMTALPADKETVLETRSPSLGKVEVADDEVRVSNVEVTVVEEVVTTVEEVVTTVEEVEVVGATEAEGDKGEKKRCREGDEDGAVKKLKLEEEKKVVEPKKLGPMLFTSPVEMFSYFYNLLHDWSTDLNVNKYEFMVLNELVSQANPQKVGDGIAAFQVRLHPKWQSRCYYLIHKDGSEDDFSYRKCCDALMPLPASLYRANGELDLEKLFPGQKGRHHREQQQQNGGGRGGGGKGDYRGGRGGGGRFGGRGGGGRGGRGGGGRRGGRGRW